MSTSVVSFPSLAAVTPPGQDDMLEAIDDVRADVAEGRVVGLMVTVLYGGQQCRTIVRGSMSRLEIIGALACAQHDTMAEMLTEGVPDACG